LIKRNSFLIYSRFSKQTGLRGKYFRWYLRRCIKDIYRKLNIWRLVKGVTLITKAIELPLRIRSWITSRICWNSKRGLCKFLVRLWSFNSLQVRRKIRSYNFLIIHCSSTWALKSTEWYFHLKSTLNYQKANMLWLLTNRGKFSKQLP